MLYELGRVLISGFAAVMPLLKTLASEIFEEGEGDIEIIFLRDSHSEAGIAGAEPSSH
jgi:hypothetical protein